MHVVVVEALRLDRHEEQSEHHRRPDEPEKGVREAPLPASRYAVEQSGDHRDPGQGAPCRSSAGRAPPRSVRPQSLTTASWVAVAGSHPFGGEDHSIEGFSALRQGVTGRRPMGTAHEYAPAEHATRADCPALAGERWCAGRLAGTRLPRRVKARWAPSPPDVPRGCGYTLVHESLQRLDELGSEERPEVGCGSPAHDPSPLPFGARQRRRRRAGHHSSRRRGTGTRICSVWSDPRADLR